MNEKIIIFDTTLRDGELTPGVAFTLEQKIQLAELLDDMGVDIIEVGYPGAFRKDFDALLAVSKQVKQATICGLAGSKPDEVMDVALAIKPAIHGRIHVYTPVDVPRQARSTLDETLDLIRSTIQLARNYRDDVEWSAFNALKSDPDFLCRSFETAIQSGATTINLPDTLGNSAPEDFAALVQSVIQRVANIDQATIAVHCHDDRGLAVANSISALNAGARQIECAINGLGARKGNANLATVVTAIAQHPNYCTHVNLAFLDQASKLVSQFQG
ncbi:MAG: 2-isopropylmalate synthase [Scytolyngbya sp. HA4215-MV1]|jgi:2-isopropylmalate synthase|nr:2-isopropylmalate synthase [Scytolyngbya sp. HA4215-MV1]